MIVDGQKRISSMAPLVPTAAGDRRQWEGGGEPVPIDSDNTKKLLKAAARGLLSSSLAERIGTVDLDHLIVELKQVDIARLGDKERNAHARVPHAPGRAVVLLSG
jgi:hypothetical protein